MATKQILSNAVNTAINTAQSLFTAGGSDVVIEAFTATNNSTVNASYKAYIVEPSGVEKPQIPFKIVVWGTNDLGIGIVNQVIPAGGTLKLECSALDSIYFTVTGRVI
tara:strand:+ start:13 stop:336 length:324 start_codon:yes stop_codon:yes gene_type:complete